MLYLSDSGVSTCVHCEKTVMGSEKERHDEEKRVELLEEEQDLFYGLFAESITDLALVNAIIEGKTTEIVEREEIFRILEGEP